MPGFRIFSGKGNHISNQDDQDTETAKGQLSSRKSDSIYRRFMGSQNTDNNKKGSENRQVQRDPSSDLETTPPLSPVQLIGYKQPSRRQLLDEALAENIRNLLPARLQLFEQWELVYSLDQHGISLNTLYYNCTPEYQAQRTHKKRLESGYADSVVTNIIAGDNKQTPSRPQGYLMVIKDTNKTKLGFFSNERLRPMDHKRYYGNGECFVWKCERFDPSSVNHSTSVNHDSSRFKAYMYTGVNDNIIYSNHSFIAVGSSSGHNSIWIDNSLCEGVSLACDTFGNEPLSGSGSPFGKFKIAGLEVWRIGGSS